MPRGRKRIPPPALPSKGYYKVPVEAALLLREGVITPTEFALYNLISMFAWDWDGAGVRVTELELSRWLNVHREHAGRMLRKLIKLGLVERTEKGLLRLQVGRTEDGRIYTTYKSHNIQITQYPDVLLKPNMVVVDISPGDDKPPPPYPEKGANLCNIEITQFPNHTISTSQKIETPPEILGFARYIGLQTAEGLENLVRSGQPPSVLLAVWRSVPESADNRIGLFLYRLANLDPGLVPKPDYSVRFCPVCGKKLEMGKCPSGHGFRRCECGELVPEGEGKICKWCGALLPELETPDADAIFEPEPGQEQETEACELWQAALDELKLKLPRAAFDSWLKGTKAVSLTGGVLVIRVGSNIARDWLDKRLRNLIKRTIADLAGRELEVRFEVKGGG